MKDVDPADGRCELDGEVGAPTVRFARTCLSELLGAKGVGDVANRPGRSSPAALLQLCASLLEALQMIGVDQSDQVGDIRDHHDHFGATGEGLVGICEARTVGRGVEEFVKPLPAFQRRTHPTVDR